MNKIGLSLSFNLFQSLEHFTEMKILKYVGNLDNIIAGTVLATWAGIFNVRLLDQI